MRNRFFAAALLIAAGAHPADARSRPTPAAAAPLYSISGGGICQKGQLQGILRLSPHSPILASMTAVVLDNEEIEVALDNPNRVPPAQRQLFIELGKKLVERYMAASVEGCVASYKWLLRHRM